MLFWSFFVGVDRLVVRRLGNNLGGFVLEIELRVVWKRLCAPWLGVAVASRRVCESRLVLKIIA